MAPGRRKHPLALDHSRALIDDLLLKLVTKEKLKLMARAQDMLDEAISLLTGAGQNELADRLTAQRAKFFFTSLAGVPLANKVKKAGTALSTDGTEANVAAVAALVVQIEDKADAPGTVLT